MHNESALAFDDVVVSKVEWGHQLLVVCAPPLPWLTLFYEGNGWSPQYATARGAKLATCKGGALWYTTDNAATVEYLETFRESRVERNIAVDVSRMDDDGAPAWQS